MAQCGVCVPRLYKNVIEEVVSGVREFFLDEGIDEQVLNDLKQQWETKVAATKATEHSELPSTHMPHPSQPQMVQTSVAPVTLVPVQITVPSQQAGGTPKSITIHVPSSALSTGVAGQQLQSILGSPAAAQTFALEASQAAEIIQRQLNTALLQNGIPLPQRLLQYQGTTSQVDGPADKPLDILPEEFPTHAQIIQPHNVIVDMPLIPETEHVIDIEEVSSQGTVENPGQQQCTCKNRSGFSGLLNALMSQKMDSLIQLDGAHGLGDSSDEMSDDDDDDEEEETKEDEKKDDDEEDEEDDEYGKTPEDPLNSEDDVSDEGGDIFDTDNVVVCQYDRITRVRNKWKFYLKDGIMHLKGKDFVFTKANGEGEW